MCATTTAWLDAARRLEAALGPPETAKHALSFARAVELDEREEAPSAAVAVLREAGFVEQLIPATLGGQLRRFDDLMALVRVVSRRDLTVAIAYGSTLLSALPVWIWGTDVQKQRLAALLRDGALGAFAITEDRAGSDLLAGEVVAEPSGDGFTVRGEKWLIGNGSRSRYVTLLCRSQPFFSLLFLPKDDLPSSRVRHLERVRTLGLRGHDVSGLSFDDCPVPRAALLGPAGKGLECTLATFQFTRTLIGAMCLGAGDSALRIALRWAHDRRLYGAPILDLPPIAELLTGAFLDLLVCEAVTLAASRGLTTAPGRMSLWSAITKYVVPTMIEQVVRDTSVVLSARFYLRQGIADGMFQKIYRDLPIAAIFEGTTLIQLSAIAGQLGALAAQREHAPTPRGTGSPFMQRLFSLEEPAPEWTPSGADLRMTSGGMDEVVQHWPLAVAALEAARAHVPDPAACHPRLAASLTRWMTELERVSAESAAWAPVSREDASSRGFDLARRYARLFAAAACFQMWLYNREHLEPDWADPAWVTTCLERLEGIPATPHDPARDAARHLMLRCLEQRRMFSLCPIAVASADQEKP
jgi:alkylation response protein AidB-like acyl-CoA dehydrogenase